MEHQAETAFCALKLTGLEVKYYDSVSLIVIKIIGSEKYYIYQFPEIAEYGTTFLKYEITKCKPQRDYIILHYEDGKKCVIQLARQNICIRGEMYERMEYDDCCLGFVYNNLYVEYRDLWIKKKKYSHIIDEIHSEDMTNLDLFTNNTGDILNSEFMPVKPSPVDIKNEGFKIVKFSFIDKTAISAFTTINRVDKIISGKYLESGRGDLFKYVNEDGELFALLFDPLTEETTMASATQTVKVVDAKPYLVKCVNGLYNDYDIKNDMNKLKYEVGYYGGYADHDGNPTKTPVPFVYCCNQILFAVDVDSREIIELNIKH